MKEQTVTGLIDVRYGPGHLGLVIPLVNGDRALVKLNRPQAQKLVALLQFSLRESNLGEAQ